MNYLEIKNIAKDLSEKDINNVIEYWKSNNTESLNKFTSLVNLWDSKEIAMATILVEKQVNISEYISAYTS